jgi:hypothetical protein
MQRISADSEDLTWKAVQRLKDKSAVDKLEREYHFALPESLRACILKYNGGICKPNKIDAPSGNVYLFGGLLSFNENDADNVYTAIQSILDVSGSRLNYFPFGLDPFGNFFCIQDDGVIFFDHETNGIEVLTKSFDDFLASLHA